MQLEYVEKTTNQEGKLKTKTKTFLNRYLIFVGKQKRNTSMLIVAYFL